MKIENIIQSLLIEEWEASKCLNEIRDILKNECNQRKKSNYNCAYRLSRSLVNIKYNCESWIDFLSNLRQTMLFLKCSFNISNNIKDQIRDLVVHFNIYIDEKNNSVSIINTYPEWFGSTSDIQSIYDLEIRNKRKKAIGDSVLYNMTGYETYNSASQKYIVNAAINMPVGSTLLACLPTGGGKSLVGQLPAYIESEGGRLNTSIEGSGLTIIVVPTVSLAIDQRRSSLKYFDDSLDKYQKPMAYYNGLSYEEKNGIFDGIKKGSVPILYISPEALLNSRFYNELLICAKKNMISRFIIDEAHIVSDWGDNFRPEFQFLSAFRKKLMEKSSGQIKTILLSATLVESTVKMLKNMFSEDDKFIEIRCDELRPEIMYFLDKSKNKYERKEKIKQIINLLPKPLILYVNKPDQARYWEGIIRELGYNSITNFTGETEDSKREKIINEWEKDNIDIIVATSAFGIGVDKKEIRSIIHCDIPGSINRFYQEVGRGGRDGFPSISLLSVLDYENNSSPSTVILSEDKLWDRWNSMYSNLIERIDGETIKISTNIQCSKLEQPIGKTGSRWNCSTILFLFRNNLIDIEEVKYIRAIDRHEIVVKLLDFNILTNEELFMDKIKVLRDKEYKVLLEESNAMNKLIQNADECWGEIFTDIYEYTDEICGGCPVCRENNEKINLQKNKRIIVKNISTLTSSNEFENSDLMITSKQNFCCIKDEIDNIKILQMINKMINLGIRTIVIPNIKDIYINEIVSNIENKQLKSHILIQENELLKYNKQYTIDNLTAIIYDDSSRADELYKWSLAYIKSNFNKSIIHIGSDKIYIKSEQKYLTELCDEYIDLFTSNNFEEDDELDEYNIF